MTEKERKQYKKSLKYQRNRIKSFANDWEPYDYGYTLSLLRVSIEGMKKYYAAGFNIIPEACEDRNGPTRLQMCEELLHLLDSVAYSTRIYGYDGNLREFFKKFGEYLPELWD